MNSIGHFSKGAYPVGMSRPAVKSTAKSECPEFVVKREVFNLYFGQPLPTSTFHKLVGKGKITRFKHMEGHFLLNDSLRRLGLPEVRELPKPPSAPSMEDVMRLGFTFIDELLFPAPSWLLNAEVIDGKTADHALRLAEQHRAEVEALDHVALKMAYFQGALDAAHLMDAEEEE